MKKLVSHALLYGIFLLGVNPLFAGDHAVSTFFVLNSSSILTFDSRGNSTVFFGAEHNLRGLRDIACNPKKPQHILASRNSGDDNAAGFLIFNAFGRIIHTLPWSTVDQPVTALAFDHAGNLYVAENGPPFPGQLTIFKNDITFATTPSAGVGRLAFDSKNNLYFTEPFISPRVFRIDQAGNVTVFADTAQGLDNPYAIAIDNKDNIFVANNSASKPAFILKIDASGTATPFATNISFQPGIFGMTFDDKGNLYATLERDNTILKFDKAGNSRVFADARDGLNNPSAIIVGTCPVKVKEKEEQEEE